MSVLCIAGSAHAAPTDACLRSADHGQTMRDEHHLIDARADFVSCGAESCPLVVRKDCARWLEELDARLPNIVVSVRDESDHDIVDVRVSVDGTPFTDRLDGVRRPVDPGDHVFRFSPTGHDPFEQHVLIREGETNRLLTVKLPAPRQLPPPAPVESESRSIPGWSLGLGGVAIAGAGAFAIFSGIAKSDLQDLRDSCGRTQSCSDGDLSSVRSKLIVANVALGIGVAALVGAIYIYIAHGDAK